MLFTLYDKGIELTKKLIKKLDLIVRKINEWIYHNSYFVWAENKLINEVNHNQIKLS